MTKSSDTSGVVSRWWKFYYQIGTATARNPGEASARSQSICLCRSCKFQSKYYYFVASAVPLSDSKSLYSASGFRSGAGQYTFCKSDTESTSLAARTIKHNWHKKSVRTTDITFYRSSSRRTGKQCYPLLWSGIIHCIINNLTITFLAYRTS